MTTTALTDAERIEMQKSIVAEHCRAENEKDWPAVHATFAQDGSASWDCVPLSVTAQGVDGVRDLYAGFDAAMPDFSITIFREYHMAGTSIIEVTIDATHQGEFMGVPASGRKVRWELVAVFEFGAGENAGKILCERAYWDNETLLRQMRGEADAPTGVGLASRT